MNLRASTIGRYLLAVVVSAAGLFTIVATQNTGGGGGGTTTPTKGSLTVNHGFGAVSTPPYQCTGSGTLTVTPQSLSGTDGKTTTQTATYTHSSLSSTTPNEPACQVQVVFSDMATGSWIVSDGASSCPATVTAGQFTTVKMWNGACQ